MKFEYMAASQIILPPGSTSDDLQAAINSAASGDTIVVSDDIFFTDEVSIESGKEITLQSDTGNNHTMFQPATNTRHFYVLGTLILHDITLDGMRSDIADGGGGINVGNGNFVMNEGVIIQNCYLVSSGGAVLMLGGNFTMNGGLIRDNVDSVNAGGVLLASSASFIMNNGIISGNTANGYGGGVYITNSTFTMNGGTIIDNRSNGNAGGIFVSTSSSFTMNGGVVSNNTANSSGGGVYCSGIVEINGDSRIMHNTASAYGGGMYTTLSSSATITSGIFNGNTAVIGGGIYVSNSSYSNVTTSNDTVFECNRASTAYTPPPEAKILYPNIQFVTSTIADHPINNYDINYTAGEAFDATFRVTYNANGGVGNHIGPAVEPCDTDVALPVENTGIGRHGYMFTSWNTAPDGSEDSYAPNDEIIVSNDMTLYAQWRANIYTVTYEPNGGNGNYADHAEYSTLYTILPLKVTGISRMMHMLAGWNTQPDGTGTSYEKEDTFLIRGDVTLYAQWKEITRSDTVNLILASVAMEEFGLSHILNTEGETLQYILGTLGKKDPGEITVCDIMAVNSNMQKTLREVIKTKLILQLKLEDSVKFCERSDE